MALWIQTERQLKAAVWEHDSLHKLQLSLDKRNQCHTSRPNTQVWMGTFCNQGKADYSDMIVH